MIIFGAGVVTGGLLVRHAIPAQPVRAARGNGTNRPSISQAFTRVEFLRRAERELNLSREQKEQADKVISASQERTKKLLEPISPQLREELQHTKAEFRAVLTAEQQAKFDEMVKQQGRPHDGRRPPAHTTEGPKSQVPAGHPEKE